MMLVAAAGLLSGALFSPRRIYALKAFDALADFSESTI